MSHTATSLTDAEQNLVEKIQQLGPWHQNITITESISVGTAYGSASLLRADNQNISLINAHKSYKKRLSMFYPQGMAGKTVLDCACNAGGHTFWAKEAGAGATYAFDVREHWINQARFIAQHRTVAPTDNMHFEVSDLMDLPKLGWPQVDFTVFKGIFYHLADPIAGLKMAADFTREILWFNSAMKPTEDMNSLYCCFEDNSQLMSGVHRLNWLPTGPRVIAKMLHWLGFVDIRWIKIEANDQNARFPRLEMAAAKKSGLLDGLNDIPHITRLDQSKYEKSSVG